MADNQDSTVVAGSWYFIADENRTLELKHVLTHSVNDGNSAEVVMNANREAIGTSATGGGYTINLKVRSTQTKREVAWKRMQKGGATFRFDIQPSKTRRDQYVNCKVATVNENGGNGEYSQDVTIVATDVEPIDL